MVEGHEVKKPLWPGKINDITSKYLEMYDTMYCAGKRIKQKKKLSPAINWLNDSVINVKRPNKTKFYATWLRLCVVKANFIDNNISNIPLYMYTTTQVYLTKTII